MSLSKEADLQSFMGFVDFAMRLTPELFQNADNKRDMLEKFINIIGGPIEKDKERILGRYDDMIKAANNQLTNDQENAVKDELARRTDGLSDEEVNEVGERIKAEQGVK